MKLTKKFYQDAFGFGLLLWVIGYALGFAFFAFVPVEQLGWYISIIMLPLTIFVAYRRLHATNQPLSYYFLVGAIWLLYPIILDYLFIVLALHNPSYYRLDVGIYYVTTFLIPVMVGWKYRKPKTL